MIDRDLMKEKLEDFKKNTVYVFLTIQYNENSKVFFYNGYIKSISNEDIVFLDDKVGEIPISIDIIKLATPKNLYGLYGGEK